MRLDGQLVYTAAIRLKDGVYSVELKLDIPTLSPDNPLFKGQTLKTKIADAVLSVGPGSKELLPTSDYETSARETIRLSDIVSSHLIVSDGGNTVNFSFENVINTQADRL